MASTLPLEARQNATFRLGLESRIGSRTGDLENLTGCTARMHIRDSWEDPTFNIELTTSNGGITLGGVQGTIDILITKAQMANFPVPAIDGAVPGDKTPSATYVYDLLITYPSTDTKCFAEGTFKVFAGVTHDD